MLIETIKGEWNYL